MKPRRAARRSWWPTSNSPHCKGSWPGTSIPTAALAAGARRASNFTSLALSKSNECSNSSQRRPSKLAPAAELPPGWNQRAELEWIGRDRQCRQLVAWFGELAKHPGLRRATVLGKTSQECRTFTGAPGAFPPLAAGVERYVFEPDAAVLAANLTGALAAEHGLTSLAPDSAYLTGDRPIADVALSAFEVDEILPYDLKRLRALLRERDIGRLEVKKRGVADDPEKVRRQLKVPGDHSATLLLARVGRKTLAILARRLENAGLARETP
jgi:hypothetical protein